MAIQNNFCASVKMRSKLQEILNKVLHEVDKLETEGNPYPKDIFITARGRFGRRVWINCCEKAKKIIRETIEECMQKNLDNVAKTIPKIDLEEEKEVIRRAMKDRYKTNQVSMREKYKKLLRELEKVEKSFIVLKNNILKIIEDDYLNDNLSYGDICDTLEDLLDEYFKEFKKIKMLFKMAFNEVSK